MTRAGAPLAVIVGLGRTGVSVARHLASRGFCLAVTDSRAEPPGLDALRVIAPDAVVRAGAFDAALLAGADCVVVSPGVAPTGPFFDAARASGLEIVGDIELFARAVAAPVVGITGTNGKSTVTALVGLMAAEAGMAVRVGGNLGEPALDLLGDPATGLYVLELSSYQLDGTSSLRLEAGAVLNVTEDHLDRYGTIAAYAASKARIFAHCATAVINLDDPLVATMPRAGQRTLTFSLRAGVAADFALAQRGSAGRWWLTRRGERLLPVDEMRIAGLHNAANALAALALGDALALPVPAMLAALRAFPGLPHRAQWIADVAGVHYVNDSKGTNVGATLAAVAGYAGPLVVIAGGDGKGQDFSPLAAAFRGKVRVAVLIGRDAPALARALSGACEIERATGLDEAVRIASRRAQPGDTVLLSPACASLDMFRDYAHRGEVFERAVRGLAA
jgi:UDP-N-acetylmuramoylalanine--D-glutamate ligase